MHSADVEAMKPITNASGPGLSELHGIPGANEHGGDDRVELWPAMNSTSPITQERSYIGAPRP
jgi:hypothetical protein